MRVSDQRMFVTRASLASAALIGCRVRQTSPRLSLTHCRSSFCTMSESRDSATGPMVIDEAGDTTQDTTADVLTSKKESSPIANKRMRQGSSTGSILRDGSPVRKSRKKKDKNAPHKPLNGYVLFLNQNRGRILDQNPGLEFPDVTKKLAAEWSHLTDEQKQPYLQQAEQDRLRYKQQLQQYKTSDQFRQFQQSLLIPDKKMADSSSVVRKKPGPKPKTNVAAAQQPVAAAVRTTDSPHVTQSDSWSTTMSKTDIPIFTEDFLEHNKVRETELRKLRKVTSEYEEQNAILSKHIEKMQVAELKLNADMEQMEEKNLLVEQTLKNLKDDIVSAFAHFAIPGLNLLPSAENVDQYVDHLHQWITSSKSSENKENKVAQEKVRSVLRKVMLTDDTRLAEKSLPVTSAT